MKKTLVLWACLATGAVAALATLGVMQLRIDAIQSSHTVALAKMRKDHQDAADKATKKALADQAAIATQYQGALNDALHHQATLRADAGRARTELVSLRKQTDSAARRIATPTTAPGAVAEYAIASSELLADCSRRYQELAEQADGHAADVRLMLAAWPVLP